MKTFNLKAAAMSSMMLLAISSCTNNHSNENALTLDISLSKATPLKEAVASMSVLPLNDSSATHFPGFFTRVEWIRDSIFILDDRREQGLYLYNSDGVLINSYTKRGNGPDEFIKLTDFDITPSSIILLDGYSAIKRIALDRKFSFIQKEEAEAQSSHFFTEREKGGGVWYDRWNAVHGSIKDKLVYTKGGKREAVLPIPYGMEDVTFQNWNVFAEIAPDTVLYFPPVEPRIYKCYDGKAEVLCELNFGDAWPTFLSEARGQHPMKLMQRLGKEWKMNDFNFLFSGKDIVISFLCKDFYYVLLLNYDDLTTYRLYKVDNKDLETLGNLVTMKDGDLVFGQPGKLIRMTLK